MKGDIADARGEAPLPTATGRVVASLQSANEEDHPPSKAAASSSGEALANDGLDPALVGLVDGEDGQWRVESILERRLLGRSRQYKVRWAGWPCEYDQWLPAGDIDWSTVREFEANLRSEAAATCARSDALPEAASLERNLSPQLQPKQDPAAKRPRSEVAPDANSLVARACGLELHLAARASASSGYTGYKGVYWHSASGKYHAQYGHGKGSSLGYFATAVDAAVAYARNVMPLQGSTASKGSTTVDSASEYANEGSTKTSTEVSSTKRLSTDEA